MSTIYTDLEQLPLDVWDGNDGDQRELADIWNSIQGASVPEADIESILEGERRSLMSVGTPRTAVYVPFKRVLKQGMVGKDVKAVHRALRASSGERPGTPTLVFGPYMKKRLIAFQKKNRLTADGVYGLATHNRLSPFFDAYGRWLMGQVSVLSPEQKKRQTIVSTAMLGYTKRYNIHYTQSGLRMQGVRQRIKPPSYPRYEDCSSFATWCYWVAGAPDPNGLGYNGYGYTGTQTRNGRSVSLVAAKPGDLIFYGGSWSVPGHVALYVGGGRVVSHGSESGPLLLSATYRRINHVRTYF